MKRERLYYLIVVLAIIVAGILSRKITGIPLFIGDFLYATMIYFGICFLFITNGRLRCVILSLIFCYGIELLQLYDSEWLSALRKTLFGRYVLGQGFLWSDLLAYSFGIAFAYGLEKMIFKPHTIT